MIRDQVVFSRRKPKIGKELLWDEGLTLQKAEHVCNVCEVSGRQNAALSNETLQVNCARWAVRNENRLRCRQCSKEHTQIDCPARGNICFVCKKPKHFAICCKRRPCRPID